jgi:hypothetical protein
MNGFFKTIIAGYGAKKPVVAALAPFLFYIY